MADEKRDLLQEIRNGRDGRNSSVDPSAFLVDSLDMETKDFPGSENVIPCLPSGYIQRLLRASFRKPELQIA